MMQFSKAQEEAINISAPALQIIACAGSGKTEVLAQRTVKFLLDGVNPESIVAFTFTEKAAGELEERITKRAAEADQRFRALPPSAAGLFVGTIHSYCLRLLQEFGGIYELFDPSPEEREWALLHRFARRLGLVDLMTQTWPGCSVSVKRSVEIFRRNLAVYYNDLIPFPELMERVPAFANCIQNYERLLLGMQLLSFDQMIERACVELSAEGRLAQALSGHVQQVLVDEYQDLNRAQEKLLQLLVKLGAQLTVVGDDDQAIYQWRGGDVSLFLEFIKRHKQSQRRMLADNYRSIPAIVTAASGFTGTIKEREPKSMSPVRSDCNPALELIGANNPDEEAKLIVKRIRPLVKSGHKLGDIAVLFRSVRTSAKPLVDTLRKEGIPFAMTGKLSLLDRPEMALLTRIFVFWAGGNWRPDEEQEVITPERLIKDIADLRQISIAGASEIFTQLSELGKSLITNGVYDLIRVYQEMLKIIGLPIDGPERQRQEQGLGRLSQLLAEFEHSQRRAVPKEWLQTAIPSASQEVSEDMLIISNVPEEGEKEQVYRQMPGLAQIFLTRLRVFLEEFSSRAAEETPMSPTLDPDAVNIMTVHQAKGLEFPIVFVPALIDRRFPAKGEKEPWYIPDDLFDKERYEGREDDERRLFYVAMTRARELLVLSWFIKYKSGGNAQVSRFISDLAQTCDRQHLKKSGECFPSVCLKTDTETPLLDTDFSELFTFNECPYKFYLRYICGFQPPIAPALNYGKVLHHVLAELARHSRGKKPPTSANVEQILSGGFYLPFAGPIKHQELFQAAQRRLQNYVKNYGQELVRTIEPERHFDVPLEFSRVRGRIDLLIQAEEGGPHDVELVDFKTAAERPPSAQHQNQLRLYAEAVRVLGMNPVKLVIQDLDADNGGRILVEENKGKVTAFRDELRKWIEDIREHKFLTKRISVGCRGCDFKIFCQSRTE
jgi:DNA helicase-2/ATP-dependent DNA helicase PcrA